MGWLAESSRRTDGRGGTALDRRPLTALQSSAMRDGSSTSQAGPGRPDSQESTTGGSHASAGVVQAQPSREELASELRQARRKVDESRNELGLACLEFARAVDRLGAAAGDDYVRSTLGMTHAEIVGLLEDPLASWNRPDG